eukprot:GHVR01061822.1.p1 GENE.GHVR01061822.1~~GHVR01061822.1.p1  ORF type:complete len:173 (-),score=8.94 GHVR01061822.1:103-621(-)
MSYTSTLVNHEMMKMIIKSFPRKCMDFESELLRAITHDEYVYVSGFSECLHALKPIRLTFTLHTHKKEIKLSGPIVDQDQLQLIIDILKYNSNRTSHRTSPLKEERIDTPWLLRVRKAEQNETEQVIFGSKFLESNTFTEDEFLYFFPTKHSFLTFTGRFTIVINNEDVQKS